MINRVDRRSQLECLKQCGELLKQVGAAGWGCITCVAAADLGAKCAAKHDRQGAEWPVGTAAQAVAGARVACSAPSNMWISVPVNCISSALQGASVLFFPEGTRSKDGRMHAFKKGAFSVAAKAKVRCAHVGPWCSISGALWFAAAGVGPHL